jgi:hypothetical protein
LRQNDLLSEIRAACAHVAGRARHVTIEREAIAPYAAALPPGAPPAPDGLDAAGATPDERAAFWLTLDAINFGSGWFPTLRKREGLSGFRTVAAGLRERFETRGAWTPDELAAIEPAEIAHALGQDRNHELMALFAASLRDLGTRVAEAGGFDATVNAAAGSATSLASTLASWDCYADVSSYDGEPVAFYKRAQIAAADLARVGLLEADDLHRLTIFADNLVPHVLRLDGILVFDPELECRIDHEELIEHGSPEEVEIRACALHAVEMLVAERPDTCAADVDQHLWTKGGLPRYKARPRHRSRCTAY